MLKGCSQSSRMDDTASLMTSENPLPGMTELGIKENMVEGLESLKRTAKV